MPLVLLSRVLSWKGTRGLTPAGLLAASVGSALGPAACGSDRPTEPPVRVAAVIVEAPDSLEVGQRGAVTLALRDSAGGVLAVPPNAAWAVSDTTVARLVDAGAAGTAGATLEGRAVGTVTVTARSHDVVGSRIVRVVPRSARVASVTVDIADPVEAGRGAVISLTLRDSAGGVIPLNGAQGRVTLGFAVSDSTVAQVGGGVTLPGLRALAPGVVTVTVRANGAVGTKTVRVIPPIPNASPGPVAGDLAFAAVGAGEVHSCGLTTDGAVYCWGINSYLGLTLGSPDTAWAPRRVALPVAATQLAVGGGHNCAVGADGAVYCWGYDYFGQASGRSRPLGGENPLPTPIQPAGVRFVAATAGTGHTCALTAAGEAWCWGLDEQGQLGTPASTQQCGDPPYACRPTPAAVATALRFRSLAAGGVQTCGLTIEGAVYCWGAANLGRSALPETCRAAGRTGPGGGRVVPCSRSPLPVAGGARFVALDAGRRTSLVTDNVALMSPACGVRDDGAVLCWIGTGAPEQVPGVRDARAVSVGIRHACAVTTRDAALCWGANEYGQLGDPAVTAAQAATPVAALPPATPARGVAAGDTHSCSLTNAGQAVCWGNPRAGLLGRGR